MVPDYPSNSNKSKEERKTLEPVVQGTATARKKRDNKLLRMVIAHDFRDIKEGLYTRYVGPKVKELSWSIIQAVIDYITNAARMMVYDDYNPVDRSKLPAERYSYNNYYYQQQQQKPAPVPTMTSELNYDEFSYPTRGDAEAVLAEMKNQIIRCRCATVLDLYSLSNISTSNYALQDWGWTNLDFAEVRQGPDGYIIALPKAKVLPR